LLFDVYLMGPAPGIEVAPFLAQLNQVFGALPAALVAGIETGQAMCVKRGVDLDTAQQFLLSIKSVGGQVEMVQAGAPAPGSSASGASSGAQVGRRGDVGRHASGLSSATGPAQTAHRPARSPTLPLPAAQPPTAQPSATGPFPSQTPSGVFVTSARTGPFPSQHGDLMAPAASDRTSTGPFPAEPVGPPVVIALEPVPLSDPLRGAEHLARVQPLADVRTVGTPIDPRLGLGVVSSAQLNGPLAERLQQTFGLASVAVLAFSSVDGGPAVALSDESVAWHEGHVPFGHIQQVGLQCDVNERPYVELVISGQGYPLPLVPGFSTFLMAETIARMTPQRAMWAGPSAIRRLRADFSEALRQTTAAAFAQGEAGRPARAALPLVRHYYDTIQRLHQHWDQHGIARWGNALAVPLTDLLDCVCALEFYEIKDHLASETVTLAKEMLSIAQRALKDGETVVALFEFRDPDWAPPAGLDPQMAGELYLLRHGLDDIERLRNATREGFLLGAVAVLTTRRLVFVRPLAKGAQVSLPLAEIESVRLAPNVRVPILELVAKPEIGGRQRFRYHVSANYLRPIAGTPLQHGQRLVDRIIEAQSRYWELDQPLLSESNRLPPPPPWLEQELATAPSSMRDRMLRALVALMREPDTPREVRLAAKLGSDISTDALRALRTTLADSHVNLSGLGDRVFLLGDVFGGVNDALFATENGLVVAGFGPGRVDWADVQRFEIIQNKKVVASLIGTRGADLGIGARRIEVLLFVERLLAVLQDVHVSTSNMQS
jgi:hypothetical protein